MTSPFHVLFFGYVICFLLNLQFSHSQRYGVLQTTTGRFCVAFNDFSHLPTSLSNQEAATGGGTGMKRLAPADPLLGCGNDSYIGHSFNGSFVIVERGNCSFFQKAYYAQLAKADGIIVINNESSIFAPVVDPAELPLLTIPIVIISLEDGQILLNQSTYAALYAPEMAFLDPNVIFISLIGLILIVAGSYLSHYIPISVEVPTENHNPSDNDGSPFVFNIKYVIIYIVCASLILVVLYFLYQYVVYVVMGLFMIGSTSGMYSFLETIVNYLKFIPKGKEISLQCCCNPTENRCDLNIRSILLFLISFSLPIIWIALRHNEGIWVLQDILGSVMILGVFRSVHLPNLKIATILLSLFFIYDIFFVFITPFFTSDGKSIMVKVATGGDSSEVLPLTIMFPHLVDPFNGVCGGTGFSILGFGDILLPGLVISFCLGFDIMIGTWKNKIYFLSSLGAYMFGLLLTYVALGLMKSAQPALLYLVPSVLGTVTGVGFYRGEFGILWRGVDAEPIRENNESNSQFEVNGDERKVELEPIIGRIERSSASS